jgi:hypothetical protein
VPNGFQIVSSRLLVADVRVDTCVSGGACQVLAVSEWNVLAVRTFVAFCQPEINNVDRVFGILVTANQKVVGFNIAMDDSFLVHNFDSLYHLHRNVQHRLQIELSSALLEQIFQTLAEHVHHHHVVHFAILGLLVAYEMQIRDSSFSSELMDELRLPEQHNVLLVFDGLLDLGR